MKLKDLIEQYGEYEVVDETKTKTWYGTLPEEKSGSIQIESCEGIQIRLEPPKPKTNTVWGLKDGDSHYWIDGVGKVKECDIWSNNSYDPMAREVGNVFLTREDAEKDTERRKVETLLLKYGGRRWFNENSENFYIYYDMDVDVVDCTNTYDFHCQGPIYFDTEKQVEKAIAEIGEDRIKKALFEVR